LHTIRVYAGSVLKNAGGFDKHGKMQAGSLVEAADPEFHFAFAAPVL